MNTRTLMTISAVVLGISGVSLSFLNQEILAYFNASSNAITALSLQILSALYLGFGMMNWMAKGTLIGGIYGRPIAIGNFMHFGVGAIVLLKTVFVSQPHREIIILLTIGYSILALSFALVMMTTPSRVGK